VPYWYGLSAAVTAAWSLVFGSLTFGYEIPTRDGVLREIMNTPENCPSRVTEESKVLLKK
jgi:hypothetical protein